MTIQNSFPRDFLKVSVLCLSFPALISFSPFVSPHYELFQGAVRLSHSGDLIFLLKLPANSTDICLAFINPVGV